MTHVRAKLNKSERRVCRVLDQPRSTQRYTAIPRDGDEHLVRRMHELVRQHPRRGYRLIWGMLRLEGWRVNRKRIHRLWRQEGLKVPSKQHKRPRLGHSANGIVRRRAEHKNHVWAIDFIHDTDARGRPLKWLSVVDEHTRECVALEVDRSMTSRGVAEVLIDLFTTRGVPVHIRSDNGPEFRSEVLQAWARDRNIRWDFIQPGCPAQNAYIERFNGTYRVEVLDANQFQSLEQARTVTEEWLAIYNEQRTHSAIGHLPPLAFKRRWQSREFPVISGLG